MSAIKIARVNMSSLGSASNKEGYASHRAAISGDGRYITFYSEGTNLVNGDINGKGDIFVRDVATGKTSLISINTEGNQFEGWAESSSISDNGKFVAFCDSDGIYLRDVDAKTTKLISQSDGTGFSASDPSISSDGRFVLYQSWKSGYATTYIYDTKLDKTTNLEPDSRSTSQAGGLGPNRISTDGRYAVAGWSIIDNKTKAPISINSHYANEIPDISITDNGRYAVFSSSISSNNGSKNIYLFDIARSTQTLVSVSIDGASGNGLSVFGDISANGRYVVFRSYASNLVEGDANDNADIFVRDLLTGNTALVSLSAHGDQPNRLVDKPAISADGRTITFISDAYNLVAGDTPSTDTNSSVDVFVVSNPFFGIYRAGREGPDKIWGYVGNDELHGFDGNDIIDGRQGADRMEGGAGNDTYSVDNNRDVIFENAGKGYDRVVASVSYTLAANVEMLTLSGRGAINATGNALANRLVGNGGNNVLDGKGGADLMEGSAGNDVYRVDHASDRIVEAVGGGRDTVITTVSYRLAAGQEIEVLQTADANGRAALKLTGNEFGNKLVGNAGANTLDGGAGIDEMRGGAGNDTYVINHAKDVVIEALRGGTDTVLSSVSYALKAGQEIESLRLTSKAGSANLTGNEFGQSLVGNAGTNVLNGGFGNDVLMGGKGADTFVFATKLGSGNVDHITDFTGADTIRLDDAIFRALAPGELKANEFKDVAKGKVDADDHILYDSRSGSLSYDTDGSGKAAAVKFAVLDNKAALTHSDFFIV